MMPSTICQNKLVQQSFMAAGVATYRSEHRLLEVVIRNWEGLQEREAS